MRSEPLVSPSAERNKDPIAQVLKRVLPRSGLVVEIASGTGQHVVHFARLFNELRWQPTDPDPHARTSIAAWLAQERLGNVAPPLDLDVHQRPWPISDAAAVICINMIHIAPWTATIALLSGADAAMKSDGVLYLYGPYRIHGEHTAPSNDAFDRSLRHQNREWGVRDLDEVEAAASDAGFVLAETVAMPSNNLSVVFRKRPRAGALTPV